MYNQRFLVTEVDRRVYAYVGLNTWIGADSIQELERLLEPKDTSPVPPSFR